MEEAYTQADMFADQKQEGTRDGQQHRRVREIQQTDASGQTFDFSRFDFSQQPIRERLGRAYKVLMENHLRRLKTEEAGEESH